jgi:fatty-acyl-CoA synthase
MAASTTAGDTSAPLLDQTIGANLEATVARFPDREAIVSVHQGVRMTYAEFDAEVDLMARRFLAEGFEVGDRSASGRRTASSGRWSSTPPRRSA